MWGRAVKPEEGVGFPAGRQFEPGLQAAANGKILELPGGFVRKTPNLPSRPSEDKEPLMKVRDIMTTDVSSCQPETNLAAVAKTMWDRDCGILPVVTNEGRVIGMITDRDICMAVATKGQTADRIFVREVSAGTIYSCLPNDDTRVALETMKTRKVRRLPVVDEQGHLKGILSMNDIVLHANAKRGIAPTEIVGTLKGICEHPHVQVGAA
jgi:CBS domain-containing protein